MAMMSRRTSLTLLGTFPRAGAALRRKLGFVDPDPDIDKDKYEHIGNVRSGNEALQLWASCPGLASPRKIVGVRIPPSAPITTTISGALKAGAAGGLDGVKVDVSSPPRNV